MRTIILGSIFLMLAGGYAVLGSYLRGAGLFGLLDGVIKLVSIFFLAAVIPASVVDFAFRKRRAGLNITLISTASSICLILFFLWLWGGLEKATYSEILKFAAWFFPFFLALAQFANIIANRRLRKAM